MLKTVQTWLPEMVEMLKVITEMESPSDNAKEAVDVLVSYLAQEAEKRGGKANVIAMPERGNHLRVEWGTGTEQILVLCHIDTVWDLGEIKKRPFKVEGDLAYGPGVMDMKSGTVHTLFAMDYLMKLNWPLSHRVVALFNSDEETGSETSRDFIEQEAKRSKAVFVLEPAISPQGAIKTARKGVGRFVLNIEGIASHSGARPQDGASAVLEMAKQIVWLHSLNDLEKGTTVNVGVVKGGTRPNVVAAHAEAEIDLRVVTKEEEDRVVPLILGMQSQTPNTTLTITGGLNRPPMERTEAVVALYKLAEKLAEEIGIEICEGSTGGGSDGNFTAALGIPTIDGLGAVGDGGHASVEWISISKMAERTALLIRLFEEVGK